MVGSVWRCLDLLAHTRRTVSEVPTLKAYVRKEDVWVQVDLSDVQATGIVSLGFVDLQISVSVSMLELEGIILTSP